MSEGICEEDKSGLLKGGSRFENESASRGNTRRKEILQPGKGKRPRLREEALAEGQDGRKEGGREGVQ